MFFQIILAIFHVYHVIIAMIGCSLNSLLIYLAMFRSPKAIESYATLIINFALTDLVECFLDYFLQIRLIPAPMDVTLTFILNGPCQYFGAKICYVSLSIFLHCIPHAVWSLLLSFGYRYYILLHPAVKRNTIILIVCIIYLPSLFQGLTYWTNFVERDKILPYSKKVLPTYDFDSETGVMTGIIDIKTWTAIYAISHMAFPITPVYIIIFILRKKIIKYLEANERIMSKETKAVHSQLLKVLTIQAMTPAFMWIGVTLYFIAQLGIYNHPLMEYLMFGSVILMPTVSPFVYLYFVRPYKTFCTRLLQKIGLLRKSRVTDNSKKINFDSGTGFATNISTLPPIRGTTRTAE